MFRRLNARILIALLGLVVSNVAVARKSQPVSPEIRVQERSSIFLR